MPISYPAHWKEPFFAKGDKYDKIKEIIDALNVLEGSEDHGGLIGLGDDDHTQYFKVIGRNDEDLTLTGTGKIVSTDGDYKHLLGRAAIGYNAVHGDDATFAHRDKMNGTDYALRQTETGAVVLNSPSGQNLNFYIGGSYKGRFTGAGTLFELASTVAMKFNLGTDINEFSIDGTLADDSDDAAPTEKAVKTYVDSFLSGRGFIFASDFIGSSIAVPLYSDGTAAIGSYVGSTWVAAFPKQPYRINVGGSTKYLKITSFTIYWYQGTADSDITRIRFERINQNTDAADSMYDNSTGWGVSGNNSLTKSSPADYTADAVDETYSILKFMIYYTAVTSSANWRIKGILYHYEYV